MPELGLLLGLAIISHKGPAGYAAARRLAGNGKSPVVLLLPAACVGLTAIPMALVQPPNIAVLNAAIFGFAASVSLHIAMDFFPRCEQGSEVGKVAALSDDVHALLDRLRTHAVASTALGALVVFVGWLVVTP
jgi:ZIP family zinc transporter